MVVNIEDLVVVREVGSTMFVFDIGMALTAFFWLAVKDYICAIYGLE